MQYILSVTKSITFINKQLLLKENKISRLKYKSKQKTVPKVHYTQTQFLTSSQQVILITLSWS